MNRKWVWITLAVALLLAVGVAALLLFHDTAGAAAELAAEGGEVQLREPLRPIRGETRVLVLAFDGVGDETLRDAVRSGRVPHIAALLGAQQGEDLYANAYAVPNALSIIPSTTMAAWTSVFTGEPAGRTGVTGNEWYAREEMRFYAPGPVSVDDHAHTLKMYTEDLLGGVIGVPTLFELADVRAHVSLAPVHRGADLLTVPAVADVADAFGRLATGLVDDDPVDRGPYEAMDEGSAERVLEAFRSHGIPDLQVVYFPGVDLYTHLAEQPLAQLHLYLQEIIDPAVGQILAAYAQAGALEQTYVVFTSDHGHTPVLNDELHALGADPEHGPPGVLEHAGFRNRPLVLEPDEGEQDYQAAVAYQGAIAYVYLADRSTCPNLGERCNWMAPPRLEEDVLAAARAFDRANRFGEGVPRMRGTLDLILARAPRPVGEETAPFEIWDGERLHPIGEYLARNPRPDLPAFEERMRDLAVGPYGHHAGDVLLLARSGMNRSINDRFYFSGRYHSWHGSPEHQDSRIPLLVARTGASGAEIRGQVEAVVGERPSQLHVVPVVRALLGQ